MHRDISNTNVLLTRELQVKLADFGLAKKITGPDNNAKLATLCGTPNFLSPEVVQRSTHQGFPVDIFSLGCLLFYFLVGRPPFETQGPDAVQVTMRRVANVDFDVPTHIDKDARALIMDMMAKVSVFVCVCLCGHVCACMCVRACVCATFQSRPASFLFLPSPPPSHAIHPPAPPHCHPCSDPKTALPFGRCCATLLSRGGTRSCTTCSRALPRARVQPHPATLCIQPMSMWETATAVRVRGAMASMLAHRPV